MKYGVPYTGLRYAVFIPAQMILYVMCVNLIRITPLYTILNWMFAIDDANPFKTEEVSSLVGCLFVYSVALVSYCISFLPSIYIVPKPNLAFKILVIINLLNNFFGVIFLDSLWFYVAQGFALITTIFIYVNINGWDEEPTHSDENSESDFLI